MNIVVKYSTVLLLLLSLAEIPPEPPETQKPPPKPTRKLPQKIATARSWIKIHLIDNKDSFFS